MNERISLDYCQTTHDLFFHDRITQALRMSFECVAQSQLVGAPLPARFDGYMM